MDLIIKVFLINTLLILAVSVVDRDFLDDRIEAAIPRLFAWWTGLSALSLLVALVWLVYQVVTL